MTAAPLKGLNSTTRQRKGGRAAAPLQRKSGRKPSPKQRKLCPPFVELVLLSPFPLPPRGCSFFEWCLPPFWVMLFSLSSCVVLLPSFLLLGSGAFPLRLFGLVLLCSGEAAPPRGGEEGSTTKGGGPGTTRRGGVDSSTTQKRGGQNITSQRDHQKGEKRSTTSNNVVKHHQPKRKR